MAKQTVIEKVKENFTVLKTAVHAGGEIVVIESQGKTFAVTEDRGEYTITTAHDNGAGDWGFGFNSKTAKIVAPLLRFMAVYGG